MHLLRIIINHSVKKIKDEMDSLTSSSKFMFKLLIIMPIILCIIIFNELLWISVSLTHLFAIPDYMGFGC